jgi:hypothetical protein
MLHDHRSVLLGVAAVLLIAGKAIAVPSGNGTTATCAAENDLCDDGNPCTAVDVCDASLECVGSGVPAFCDDGLRCTVDTCDTVMGCVSTVAPATGCNTSNAKGSLSMKVAPLQGGLESTKFQWKAGTIPLGDFGSPTTSTDYEICALDQNKILASGLALAAATCGSKSCWTESDKGVKYIATGNLNSIAVQQLLGGASIDGKAKVQVKIAGSATPFDINSIAYPVTVQVTTSDGQCWQQVFTSTDEKKNDGVQLKLSHSVP